MRPPLALVLAGCVLGGAALGAGGAALLRDGGAEGPLARPVVARLAPSVLDRPQRPADLTRVPATPGLRRSTLRRVGPLGDGDLLLVGRDVAGGRCIIVVSPAAGLFRAGCVPEAAFASGGTRVAWSGPDVPGQRSAEWGPDGTVRAG